VFLNRLHCDNATSYVAVCIAFLMLHGRASILSSEKALGVQAISIGSARANNTNQQIDQHIQKNDQGA
jgi:hypothetical protein